MIASNFEDSGGARTGVVLFEGGRSVRRRAARLLHDRVGQQHNIHDLAGAAWWATWIRTAARWPRGRRVRISMQACKAATHVCSRRAAAGFIRIAIGAERVLPGINYSCIRVIDSNI